MPGPGYIWVVPGFGGSELYLQDASGARVKLWLDIPSLLRGTAAYQLVWNAQPAGSSIVPGGLMDMLGFGYGGLVNALQQFVGQGYTPMPWPYDFRLAALDLGAALAARIVNVGPADHKIIAHSYGTVVTQIAMGLLKLSQMGIPKRPADTFVSTVLALGPIFSGSYSTVRAWREEEDSLNHLALGAAVGSINPFSPSTAYQTYTSYKRALLTAFCSWPSTYDMLPYEGMDDDPGDTQRTKVYLAQYWTQALVPPDPTQITRTFADSQTWHNSYPIDASKWLVIAGVDRDNQTPWRLTWPPDPVAVAQAVSYAQTPSGVVQIVNPDQQATLARRATMPGIAYTPNGDNRSTLGSQTRPGVQTYQLWGAHADLQSHPTFLRLLPQFLGLQGGVVPPLPVLPVSPVPFLAGGALAPAAILALNWPQGGSP